MQTFSTIFQILLFSGMALTAAVIIWSRVRFINRNIQLGKATRHYSKILERWAAESGKEIKFAFKEEEKNQEKLYTCEVSIEGSILGAATHSDRARAEHSAAREAAEAKGIDDRQERIKNMILMAFGQKRMFDKPFVGAMHFMIYAGFVLINLEILEIVLDGFTGQHRLFGSFLGAFYPFLIGFFEFLGFAVVAACVIFLLRRNVMKNLRFEKPEMKGWPKTDANLILIFEIVLMFFLYTMNSTDSILQMRGVEGYAHEGVEPMKFLISRLFIPIYSGLDNGTLILLERTAWFLHIGGIFGFAIYVTYSKHLHIALAFPNTYFADQGPKGEMENMDTVTTEVKIAMGLIDESEAMAGMDPDAEPERFGAKDANDLKWKNLLDAYTCTECGRCTAECPANQTGKKLSPRKIMMDTRDRIEEIGYAVDNNNTEALENKSLYGEEYITKEELMACTSCNACVEACPVNINPLDIILQMRRYVAMEEADVPDAWKSMFSNVENSFSPWAFAATERFKWGEDMMAEENGEK